MSAGGDADRIIARLPEDRRLAILDAVVRSSRPGSLVAVEYAHDRKLDGARRVVGELLAVAYAPGGSSTHVLIVKPAQDTARAVALSAAHVLRIRVAWPYGKARPGAHRLGEVLAGPPLPPRT